MALNSNCWKKSHTFSTVYRVVIYVNIKSLMIQNESMNNIVEVVYLESLVP